MTMLQEFETEHVPLHARDEHIYTGTTPDTPTAELELQNDSLKAEMQRLRR